MAKEKDPVMLERIEKIREGLEPQPLKQLMTISPKLREKEGKYRRILCKVIYPSDVTLIADLEEAKEKLIKARQ
jgi:hypothetical protein